MAIFRAEDKSKKDSRDVTVEIEEESSPQKDLASKDSGLIEPSQPPSNQWQAEKTSLNQQQRRFAEPTIEVDPAPPLQAEKQYLQSSAESAPSRRGAFSFGGGSGFNKKVAAGLSIFILPTAVGFILVLIGLQAGFTLHHIQRVTTGLRFGSLHLVLNRRFNHLRREYVRTSTYQTTTGNQFARYTRTSLGSRLLGVTPDKIYSSLNRKGYKFTYGTLRGGSFATFGRKTLVKVEYPDGRIQEIKSSADARGFLSEARSSFDDLETSRFKAMRSSFLLAKQIGIPFLRFKVVIDMFRDGSFKNLVRGSPAEFLGQRIDEEVVGAKKRLAQRLPRLNQNLKKFGVDELTETTRQSGDLRQAGLANVTAFLQDSLDGRQRAFAVASAGSIVVGVITLACVLHEIGTMIKDAFKMKIRGSQDNAATLQTVSSQIKAGYATTAVVSDFSQRFTGFATSANYQVATNPENAAPYIGREGSDFSEFFNLQNIFGGFSVSGILRMSSLVSPAALAAGFQNYVEKAASVTPGFFGQIFSAILDFVGGGLSLTVGYLEAQFARLCDLALNSVIQIGILVAEIIATILITIFSGGLGGAAKVGAGQVVKEIVKVVGRSLAFGAAGGIALDILLFDYLLVGVIKNASGLETALLSNPQDPAQGAENYASVDYGTHYLKEGEGLNMGGYQISTSQSLLQTQTFLALQKEQYLSRGLVDNIFNLENPYSVATSLALVEHQGLNWQQKAQHYSGQLLVNLKNSFDLSQPAYARTPTEAQILALLYPGQTTVIGFDEAEMSGEVEALQHVNNSIYVEDNMDSLFESYSGCLALDASEYLMSNMGVTQNEHGREFYPSFCDEAEAKRYKIYYQDCLLIDGLQRWGTNTSPMFSSQCDHLLPQIARDTIDGSGGGTSVQAHNLLKYANIETDLLFPPKTDKEAEVVGGSPRGFSLPIKIFYLSF